MLIEYTSLEEVASRESGLIHDAALAIISLDFSEIVNQLSRNIDTSGWDFENATVVSVMYKNFLFLCAKYDNERIVPSFDVDAFWHNHILETSRYEKDCNEIFGRFLHHYPYFGYRNDEEKSNWEEVFKRTQSLHKLQFGDILYDVR